MLLQGPSLIRRTLLAATAVVILGASIAAAPANAGDDTSMTGAPAVGDCFDLTLSDANDYSVSDEAVDCGDDHTTKVFAVRQLPDNLTWDSSDAAIEKVVGKACWPAYYSTVGGTDVSRFTTQYTWFWFAPSRSQRDAGARWFSCHVSVRNADALADLAEPLERVDRHVSDAIARCAVGRGPYYLTTCAARHTWRMTHAQLVRGTRSTDAKIEAAAERICPRHVSTRHWLYSWNVVAKRQFILGCSTKTRR